MNQRQQQIIGILFSVSFLFLIASQVMHTNGNSAGDFLHGIITGMGIAGMLLTIVAFGKFKKRNQ